MKTAPETLRDSLKHELLKLINRQSSDRTAADHPEEINQLVQRLSPLSPFPDPAHRPCCIAGSWVSVYAIFGSGRSQGKTHYDDSTLGLQTFRAFPETHIRVTQMVQEIAIEPKTYNNVVLFETIEANCAGMVIVHGGYEPDVADARRFQVLFTSAEVRGRGGVSDAQLRTAMGVPEDYALNRLFKPARLHSDVIYVDESMRINIGGMGGVYVLERRAEPPISL